MALLDSLGFGFTEKMGGTYRPVVGNALPGGRFEFNFEVDSDDVSDAARQIVGRAIGHVSVEGLAERAPAEGSLELSPFWKRRIRYTFSFTGNDGKRYQFDGWKTINPLRMIKSWTTLPGKIFEEDSGTLVAEATAYFDLRKNLLGLLSSFRTAPKGA